MLFAKLKEKLAKTRQRLGAGLRRVIAGAKKLDEEALEKMEETLVAADVGIATVTRIIDDVRERYRAGELIDADAVLAFLRDDLKKALGTGHSDLAAASKGPTVVIVTGVNGVGKTTSIAKLEHLLTGEGKTVLLAACDTFRAAAVEQLGIWAERAGVEVIKQQSGSDPAAVAFDACDAAVARGMDYLIIDTAGRMHTQDNLMRELEKIRRIVARKIEGAPHEVLLVLDATTGQTAVRQAEAFMKSVQVTSLFLAKLDGTAKGGIAIAIAREIDIPVKYIGVGETLEDIEPFDPETFVDAILQ